MISAGIQSAAGVDISNPCPINWLGLAGAPPLPPISAKIGKLNNNDIQALLCQMAYDLSGWDYAKIGNNNQLGMYQISTEVLEAYGLIAKYSN